MPDEIANADFESAISATGFGLFNVMLIIVTFPSMVAIMCDTASIAYVVPSGAECDLGLTNTRKGLMIAAVYFGMICSAIPWSYIADTMGRKPVIAYGLLVDAMIVIASSTTQHWVFLMICRFFSGICICGPFASLYTYLSETSSTETRHPIIYIVGIFLSIGALLLPLLAMLVIPPIWEIEIAGYKYHSWHLFLFICAMPGLVGGLCFFLFFPESPKYLMTQGHNDKAMKSFTRIYKMNHKKDEEYPIKSLVEDKMIFVQKKEGVSLTAMQKAKQQFIDVIFSKEYCLKAFMVFFVDFCVMMCQNTVRLWVPQIFKLAKDLESRPELDQSLCGVFEYGKNQSQNITHTPRHCKSVITVAAYINNLWYSIGSIITYLIAIALVNKMGVKLLLTICMACTALISFSLFFTTNEIEIVVVITIYLALENIASSNVVAVSTSVFPTQIRTTIVSTALLVGRIGSMIGNTIFPLLMAWGCIQTVLWISIISMVAFIICIFIPEATGEPLK